MSSETLITTFYVFVLAAFLGYQVISRVPPLLHTPLMSATNAISGISLVGSLVTAGAHQSTVSTILGFVAVTCATTNVVGGFVITDRMLKMFKRGGPGRDRRVGARGHEGTDFHRRDTKDKGN
jgi:NAD(P) transhydrogenase subunit alpha